MSKKIVYVPTRQHHCNIGWVKKELSEDHPTYKHGYRYQMMPDPILQYAPDDSVVACEECGRTWVAQYPDYNVLTASWRREGPFERWLRQRDLRLTWLIVKIGLFVGVTFSALIWALFR